MLVVPDKVSGNLSFNVNVLITLHSGELNITK